MCPVCLAPFICCNAFKSPLCCSLDQNSIPCMAQSYFVVWIYYILYIFSFVDGHLGCFYFLAIVNNTAVNIYVQDLVLIPVFISFEYVPRSSMAGS